MIYVSLSELYVELDDVSIKMFQKPFHKLTNDEKNKAYDIYDNSSKSYKEGFKVGDNVKYLDKQDNKYYSGVVEDIKAGGFYKIYDKQREIIVFRLDNGNELFKESYKRKLKESITTKQEKDITVNYYLNKSAEEISKDLGINIDHVKEIIKKIKEQSKKEKFKVRKSMSYKEKSKKFKSGGPGSGAKGHTTAKDSTTTKTSNKISYDDVIFKMDKYLPDDEELQNDYYDLIDEKDKKGLIDFFNTEADMDRMHKYMPKNGTLEDLVDSLVKSYKRGQELISYIKAENPSTVEINLRAAELGVPDRSIEKLVGMAKGTVKEASMTSFIYGQLPKRILGIIQNKYPHLGKTETIDVDVYKEVIGGNPYEGTKAIDMLINDEKGYFKSKLKTYLG
jgi:hypothetical protein